VHAIILFSPLKQWSKYRKGTYC